VQFLDFEILRGGDRLNIISWSADGSLIATQVHSYTPQPSAEEKKKTANFGVWMRLQWKYSHYLVNRSFL